MCLFGNLFGYMLLNWGFFVGIFMILFVYLFFWIYVRESSVVDEFGVVSLNYKINGEEICYVMNIWKNFINKFE